MIKEKHSHIDADEEQKRYLDIEKNLAAENKPLNIVLTTVFFAFIFVFGALFWILPDKDVSENENRSLKSFPDFSWEALSDGSFTKEFAVYMADQFPARDFFVELKASSEAALCKGINNGVFLADDGYLVSRFDSSVTTESETYDENGEKITVKKPKFDPEILEKNIGYISKFISDADSSGIDVTVALAGRTMDVCSSAVSGVYGRDSSDEAWSMINTFCEEQGVEYTDLMSPLRERFENGEYVYYKTDHHWTSLGAFYAYEKIADAMGIRKADLSDFRRESVTDSFFGTTWSNSGAMWTDPDSIELFRYDGDESLKTVTSEKSFDGLYYTDALSTKDKYSVFIGGNSGRCDITSGEEREKILVVKDSFFHSVAPFLAKEYDITAIDLRYAGAQSLTKLCAEEGIDRVLILFNAETLGEESNLRLFCVK